MCIHVHTYSMYMCMCTYVQYHIYTMYYECAYICVRDGGREGGGGGVRGKV